MSETTIFRSSALARCLSESIDELIAAGKLDDTAFDLIMDTFDKACLRELHAHSATRGFMTGTKISHNNCEGVWLFDVHNFRYNFRTL